MAREIQIIGSASDQPISAEEIQQLLSDTPVDLLHGGEFTGKPTTILHVNAKYVLKGRNDLNFSSEKIATSWVSKQLEKDIETKLYHPSKTWFIVPEDNGHWGAYNISPRLTQLHLAIEAQDITTEKRMEYLIRLSEIYLTHAAVHSERLDEGLSNFGVDSLGDIYYLDDDFYIWDYLLSFTSMVALWLRKFSSDWLNNDAAQLLGSSLKEQLLTVFKDHKGVDYPGVLREHLNSLFLNDMASERAKIICNELFLIHKKRSTVQSDTHETNEPTTEALEVISADEYIQWLSEDEPIAIIADVHANLPALDAVLNDINAQNIKRIICLGDIVGYGPHPAECIERMHKERIFTIRGNHDHMVGNDTIISNISQSGAYVAQWTVKQLQPHHQEWLSSLPLQVRKEHWITVHGAPRDTTFFNAYVYDRTADSNLEWMLENNFTICFHGHSHLQGFYQSRMGISKHHKELKTYSLKSSEANLICAGSVGQPRSGNPGAEYIIYNPQAGEITLKRISYDIAPVAEDMRKNGFPEHLVTRLEEGF